MKTEEEDHEAAKTGITYTGNRVKDTYRAEYIIIATYEYVL